MIALSPRESAVTQSSNISTSDLQEKDLHEANMATIYR